LQYNFEWDKNKAKKNFINHKVSFEQAATVFKDPNALTVYDNEHSIKDERWITLGISSNGILLVVCHTYKQVGNETAAIRIISGRKAAKNEKKQYNEV